MRFSQASIEVSDASFLHLFDSVNDFPPLPPSNFKDRKAMHNSSIQEAEELAEHLKSIKTGCLSVSSLKLGISESPLGDATILPVVTLRELRCFEGQAKLGIGYNPTNMGFQFLQEAYQRGEWHGPKPRFQQPKGRRFFGTTKSPTTHRRTNLSSRSRKVPRKSRDAEAPSSYRMEEHELGSANAQELVFAAVSPEVGSNAQKCKIQSNKSDCSDVEMVSGESTTGFTKVKYNPGEDGEESTITFSTPLTDDFIDQLNKTTEDIRNGGRAKAERRLNQALRYFGVETMVPSDDDSNDDCASEDGESLSDEDLLTSEPSPLMDPSNQREAGTGVFFPKNAVAAWFKLS